MQANLLRVDDMTYKAAQLLISAFALALTLVGCTDAGLCTRGELDCACKADKSCDNGMSCSADNRCMDDGTVGGTGGNGTGGNTVPPPDAGPVNCTGANVEAACASYCKAFCKTQAQFCIASRCDPNDCKAGGGLLTECKNLCAATGDPAACARDACEAQLDTKCDEFGLFGPKCDESKPECVFQSLCQTGATRADKTKPQDDPVCVLKPDHGCSDTCGTSIAKSGGQLAKDGQCDDGGDDSKSSRCVRGTDCSDCSPRKCASANDSCKSSEDCCGFRDGLARCGEFPEGSGGSCLQVCELGVAGSCPTGYSCSSLEFKTTGESVNLCLKK